MESSILGLGAARQSLKAPKGAKSVEIQVTQPARFLGFVLLPYKIQTFKLEGVEDLEVQQINLKDHRTSERFEVYHRFLC